jgi:hypothetical protein
MDQRDNHTKARLTVRLENETLQEIERLAQLWRTNTSQVGRVILEDGVRALAEHHAA